MTITFADDRDDPLPGTELTHLAKIVLSGEAVPPEAEVAVTMVDVAEMTALNRSHMGKDGPTDVLSFPLEDATPGQPPTMSAAGPPPLLGDVVICPEVVLEHAVATDTTFDDEMALMVVHGLLHLLGYDHVDDEDAVRMEERERTYLEAVGRRRR